MTDQKDRHGYTQKDTDLYIEPAAALVKRTKRPGLDREKTVLDAVRLKDKNTTLEGIDDSVSYETEEICFVGRDIIQLIKERIKKMEQAKSEADSQEERNCVFSRIEELKILESTIEEAESE